MPRLQHLRLHRPQDGDATLMPLKAHPSLEVVDLGFSAVTDRRLVHLATLPKLRVLQLYGSTITDDNLREVGRCVSLEVLDLSGTSVTDHGVKHLSSLRKLTHLDLSGTKITVKALESVNWLPLADLCVENTAITADEAAAAQIPQMPFGPNTEFFRPFAR